MIGFLNHRIALPGAPRLEFHFVYDSGETFAQVAVDEFPKESLTIAIEGMQAFITCLEQAGAKRRNSQGKVEGLSMLEEYPDFRRVIVT